MIYKKIEIAVDGYKKLQIYTLIFWIIPLKCISTESVR